MITQKELNALPLDKMEIELKKITIIDKIIFSEISKEDIKSKIKELREIDVPNRTVFLNNDSEEIVFYWFKNWLHPKLKRIIRKSPRSKVGCSQKVIENDNQRDFLNFYENGQQNYNYNLDDIEKWCNN